MAGFWETRRQIIGGGADAEEAEPWSVARFAEAVSTALLDGLGRDVGVRGEIASWSRHASGHRYFRLKDATAAVECVMFKGDARSLAAEPAVGEEVVVRGSADFWAKGGRLSLRVRRLDPVGEGALEAAFQALVAKLREEGLFDADRKMPPPRYPGRVAVVTSLGADALQDVLKVLRRQRHLRVLICPVPVQGDAAAPKIAKMLGWLDRRHGEVGGLDAVLLVRGGGSRQDLWAFNEEAVARAVARMRLPVVTGVGHETDTTVADLAADLRCHTPTEAAQWAVRHWNVAGERVGQLGVALRRNVRLLTRDSRTRLANAAAHETFRRPGDVVDRRRRDVDDAEHRLDRAVGEVRARVGRRLHAAELVLNRNAPAARVRLERGRVEALAERLRRAASVSADRARLDALRDRLARASRATLRDRRAEVQYAGRSLRRLDPSRRAAALRGDLASRHDRLRRALLRSIESRASRVGALRRQVEALGPENVLRRGFSVTLDAEGTVVRDPADVSPGDRITTRVAGGDLTSVVGG